MAKTYEGSIELIMTDDYVRFGLQSFQCLSADVSKLPTTDDIQEGASCFVLDAGAMYFYHKKSKRWF